LAWSASRRRVCRARSESWASSPQTKTCPRRPRISASRRDRLFFQRGRRSWGTALPGWGGSRLRPQCAARRDGMNWKQVCRVRNGVRLPTGSGLAAGARTSGARFATAGSEGTSRKGWLLETGAAGTGPVRDGPVRIRPGRARPHTACARLAAASGEGTIGACDLLDVKVGRANRAKVLIKNSCFADGGFARGAAGRL